MKKFIQILIRFAEGIPLIGTVTIALYVTIKHAVEPFKTDQLLGYIIMILGTSAISEIVQNYLKIDAIHKGISSLGGFSKSLLDGRLSNYFLRTRSEYISFEKRVENARKIYLLGTSLEGVITNYSTVLMHKLKDGCELRFILLDPNSKAVEARAVGLFSIEKPDELTNDINRTLGRLAKLGEIQAECKLHIKTTNFITSYSMVLLDPDKKNGEIVVEIYPFLSSSSDRPHFELKPADGKWYDYFKEQFETIWNAGADYLKSGENEESQN